MRGGRPWQAARNRSAHDPPRHRSAGTRHAARGQSAAGPPRKTCRRRSMPSTACLDAASGATDLREARENTHYLSVEAPPLPTAVKGHREPRRRAAVCSRLDGMRDAEEARNGAAPTVLGDTLARAASPKRRHGARVVASPSVPRPFWGAAQKSAHPTERVGDAARKRARTFDCHLLSSARNFSRLFGHHL